MSRFKKAGAAAAGGVGAHIGCCGSKGLSVVQAVAPGLVPAGLVGFLNGFHERSAHFMADWYRARGEDPFLAELAGHAFVDDVGQILTTGLFVYGGVQLARAIYERRSNSK